MNAPSQGGSTVRVRQRAVKTPDSQPLVGGASSRSRFRVLQPLPARLVPSLAACRERPSCPVDARALVAQPTRGRARSEGRPIPPRRPLFITGSGRSNPLDDLKPAHVNVRVSTTIVPLDHVDNAALASCAGLALLARHAEGTLRERQPGHARPPTVTRVRPILLLARLSCPRLPGLARTSRLVARW
jgi:hypothetical protein